MLLLAGAVVAFGTVGVLAYGGLTGILTGSSPAEIRVCGGFHLPSVGAIIATVLFVVIYVAWDFYPHNYLPNLRFPTK